MSLFNKLVVLLIQLALSYGFVNRPSARFSFQATGTRPFLGTTQTWAKKANDKFDIKELKQRINEVTNPYHQLFAADWNVQERPEQVYVILFNPETDEQGVHTIEYPKGSGSNFVLAFESKEACDKFAASLEAQNFEHPSPQRYEIDALESFCDMLGVYVQVVPEGMEILPPTQNVQSMGQHNPNLRDEQRNLDFLFDMFELEVDELGLLAAETGSWE